MVLQEEGGGEEEEGREKVILCEGGGELLMETGIWGSVGIGMPECVGMGVQEGHGREFSRDFSLSPQ